MANDMHKEEWINRVMNSTQHMERATPSSGLAEKALAGISNPVKARIVAIPVKQWAAAAIVLLALNIGSVVYFTSRNRSNADGNSAILADMQTESTYNY